jgi:hypothetical protein
MKTLTFSELIVTGGALDLGFVRSRLHASAAEPWSSLAKTPLTDQERADLDALRRRLAFTSTSRANEATLWARAIYPLLMVAEVDDVRAWSQVALSVVVRGAGLRGLGDEPLRLHGIVDGALAVDAAGQPVAPFFLVVEAKRALDAVDPLPQLQGAMLTVALQRLEDQPDRAHDVFGCFTIGDAWTFVRGRFARGVDADGRGEVGADYHPSRELSEHAEADTIASILKAVVAAQRPRAV